MSAPPCPAAVVCAITHSRLSKKDRHQYWSCLPLGERGFARSIGRFRVTASEQTRDTLGERLRVARRAPAGCWPGRLRELAVPRTATSLQRRTQPLLCERGSGGARRASVSARGARAVAPGTTPRCMEAPCGCADQTPSSSSLKPESAYAAPSAGAIRNSPECNRSVCCEVP